MIVATCASLASRERLLERTVASLLPQVDAFAVYLNGYERIPAFLQHPKVLYAILSSEAGYRAGEAKLWFWDADAFKAPPTPWHPDTVALVVDDDIVYPRDYAARMIEALDRRPGTVACVHASILVEPIASWRESRRALHFRAALAHDARVHVPGTGTIAFRAGDVPYSVAREHPWSHCCDIAFARFALRRGLEVWSVARPADWLQSQPAPPNGFSVCRARIMADVDDVETGLLREVGPWPALEVPGEFRAMSVTARVQRKAARKQRAARAGR